MNNAKKIVFTGGGSGGHIMPNIALIEQLKNFKVYYIGSAGMEKKIIKNYKNIEFIEIPSVKFERKLTLKNLLIPFKLISIIKKCKKILTKINPDIIFSKGGYVSIPVCLAGNKLNIPVITHESDLSVGLANKIIAKNAKLLCCSFKETAENYGKNAIFTGSPIRNKIYNGDKSIILNRHKIILHKPVILIVGGSLGAKAINNAIWESIDTLIKKYTVIHIVGKNNINKAKEKISDYHQIEFANDIENYFDVSDIVISRAGSNTIFELLALKKPMLLIPLPKNASRGDQILNAQIFEYSKFASVLHQENLNQKTLLDKIEETFLNKYTYQKSMNNANYADGNKKIIDLIEKTAK